MGKSSKWRLIQIGELAIKKLNQHIEIVRSARRGYEASNETSAKSVFDVLSKHYRTVGISTVNNIHDFEALVRKQPDLVFLRSKFLPENTGDSILWISALLKKHGINHTGSEQMAIELESDKALAKLQVKKAGLSTARFVKISADKPLNFGSLSLEFPLFVKPTTLSDGIGIDANSVVHDEASLAAKIAELTANVTSDILIEEYLDGREFSVAVLRDEDTGNLLTMPIEIIPAANSNGNRILDYATKHTDQNKFWLLKTNGLICLSVNLPKTCSLR